MWSKLTNIRRNTQRWGAVPQREEGTTPTCTLLPFVGPAQALLFQRYVHHVDTAFYYYSIPSPLALSQVKGVDHTDKHGRSVSLRLDPRTHTAHHTIVGGVPFSEIRSYDPQGTLMWRMKRSENHPSLVVFRQQSQHTDAGDHGS